MKKIFAILTIVAATACNSNSPQGTADETTNATTIDSVTAAESPLTDAVNTADSVGKMMQDSNHMMMDTSHKK